MVRARSLLGRASVHAAALLVLACGVVATAAAQSENLKRMFPALSSRVVDAAGVLDATVEAALTSELEALENTSSDQLVVVTVPDLGGYPIEEFGYQLGRHWAIGQAAEDNGVLLIIAPTERKVRIEVGRGLEGTMTDALADLVIRQHILPAFRNGDFPGGIRLGVADIKQILLGNAEEVEERALALRRGQDQLQTMDWVVLLFIIAIIAIAIYNSRHGPSGQGAGNGARRRRSGWTSAPAGGPRGGWSGSRGGGGFRGGGGGFGGGGASGGW